MDFTHKRVYQILTSILRFEDEDIDSIEENPPDDEN